MKIGVVCPGYRPQSSLIFRNATKQLAQGGVLPSFELSSRHTSVEPSPRPQSRAAATGLATDQFAFGQQTHSSSSSSSDSPDPYSGLSEESESDEQARPLQIYRPLTLSSEFGRICCFLRQFSTAPNEFDYSGFMPSIPDYLRTADDGSCLQLAVRASSYANAACPRGMHAELMQARKYHGQALAALKTCLLDPNEVTKDSTLVAMLVLVVFEVRTRRRNSPLVVC